ncbi:peptidase insulinase like peptidase, partial [Cryptosporidium sp. chipmunk genotype I]|uniref:peptidase insulinase like peptidase n=1 Tax=Cryptosporidium sp. chipmunk genotype I TaxID=1280935 RepID=UPI00351A24B4
LFSQIFMVILTRNFYEIISAKYMINIDDLRFIKDSTSTSQLNFAIFGFTDHIGEVIAKLQAFIMNFTTYITQNEFDLQKERLKIGIKGLTINPSVYSDITYMRSEMFINHDCSFESQLSFLETIKFEELIKFSKFFLKDCKLEGFLLGNLNPIQSFNVINKFSSTFLFEKGDSTTYSNNDLFAPITSGIKKSADYLRSLFSYISTIFTKRMDPGDQDYLQIKEHLRSSPPLLSSSNSVKYLQKLDLLSLKRGSKIYSYYLSKSKISLNSAILLTIAIGYNYLKNSILTNILNLIISEEFFTEIRTERQLGYVVGTEYEDIVEHISGISFTVISSNQNVETLAENILEFWNDWFSPGSIKITEELFNTARESYIETLKTPMINLNKVFSEFSSEIIAKNYNFSWRSKYINFAEKLTYQEFLDWFKKIYDNSNIFMFAVQSPNSEESDILNSLSNYVPENFTKFNSSNSMFNLKNIKTYNQWNVFNAV